ncbi:MAG: carboxypeptidase M32 [Oscillospiraceae bacterium]|nr:carboxypeptidase M32 [Oscillospiraceae bacterium]
MAHKAEQQFRSVMQKIDYLTNISQTLSWDMRVMMPQDAAEYRGAEMGFLAGQIHALETSEEMAALLQELEAAPIEDRVLAAMVRKARFTYDKLSQVPEALYSAYADHNLKTEHIWAEARAKNDYAMVLPYLKQEFAYKKELISCAGFANDPLTGLMDEWEAGTTRQQIDRLYEELKTFLIPFVRRLRDEPQPNPALVRGFFPKEKQKAFCREVLRAVGYNFDRGRVDEGAHPYTTFNYRKDIRFTCRYFEDDFTRATLSSLHEGGHAIHWQNMGEDLDGTTLAVSTSLSVDESQSRFQENILGRSLAFWEYFLPVARKFFPDLGDVSPEDFYRALNALHVSPIRLTADELTYNLHIILRYELEKALLDGSLSFEDLPAAWSEKSEAYLGVRPANDADGVLQDMHWFSGYICYFQSYVLGNCYDGHFLHAMQREIPDMFDQVRRGDFSHILRWNVSHIHRFASTKTPRQVLWDATGEELSARHYLQYLTDKYTEIYKL